MTTVLVVGSVAAWAMVGVIWTVQLVHYPMLATMSELVPAQAAVDHQRRISWVVGPLMAAEGVTALVLLVDRPASMGWPSAWLAAALLHGGGAGAAAHPARGGPRCRGRPPPRHLELDPHRRLVRARPRAGIRLVDMNSFPQDPRRVPAPTQR